MKTNKNIDRLFQEKFKDFEVSPSDNVWENIEHRLKINKPKSLFPLWLRIGSVAAVLTLLTVGGVAYFNNDELGNVLDGTIITNSDTNILNNEEDTSKIKKDILNASENETIIAESKNDSDENNITSKSIISDKEQLENQFNSKSNKTTIAGGVFNEEQNTSKNNTLIVQPEKSTNIVNKSIVVATNNNSFKQDIPLSKSDQIKNSSKDNLNNDVQNTDNDISLSTTIKNKEEDINSTSSQLDQVAQNSNKKDDFENLNKSLDTKVDLEEAEEDIIAQENKKTEEIVDLLNEDSKEKIEEDTKKWSVASIFGPVYYNSFTENTSPLDSQFINSPKKGSKSVSYGVKVEYQLNKKLSLRSGASLVNVGYEIRDVYINPSQQLPQRITNIDYNNNFVILSVNATNFLNASQLETLSSTPTKGVLNQEFGYIEVPLELKYKLNNSQKLGINVIGGFSTLFLNKNEVYVETDVFSSNIGKANNLNSVNFSGNFGLDLDYKINKRLYFNVAPMIKIHTSTFSKNADNFKPYTLGVYTGLNYKF